MTLPGQMLLVVAIDFGTTFSRFAFSFGDNPLNITTSNWIAGDPMSFKTPSCILFDVNGNFDSFGYDAQHKYENLAEDGEEEEWYYFCQFKMKLFGNKSSNRSFSIEDAHNNTMSAKKVFAASIKYLKDRMLASYPHVIDPQTMDILWVLTVPAIWSEESKQFMREAAEEAGIPGSKMILGLESEVASVYFKYLSREEAGEISMQAGSKNLVMDLGGMSIDITEREVQNDGSLKEIHRASGGDWGDVMVDHAFQNLLSEMIGDIAFHSFLKNNMADKIALFW